VTTKRKPTAPAGLSKRGRRFWSTVVGSYSLRADEVELLAELCRALDELEAMRVAVAEAGVTVVGSRGQVRPNPLLSELRGTRAYASWREIGVPADVLREAGITRGGS
jgi:hypothetical protein